MRLVKRPSGRHHEKDSCVYQHISLSETMVNASAGVQRGNGDHASPVAFEYRRVFNTISLATGDAAALALSLTLAGALHYFVSGAPLFQWWINLILPIWMASAVMFRLYPGWGLGAIEELRREVLATSLTFGFAAILLFWGKMAADTSRFSFSIAFLISLVLIPALRRSIKALLVRTGRYGLPVVLYGAGETGQEVVRSLRAESGLGYRPIAFLDDHPGFWGEFVEGIPVLGDTNLVLPDAQAAILAMPRAEREFKMHLLEGPLSYYRNVIILPDMSEMPSLWVRTFDLGGILGLDIKLNLADTTSRILKRSFDLAFTLLFSPLWITLCSVVAVMIWLEDGQSPLFRQTRIGLRGNSFQTLKFRTMVSDADSVLERYLNADPALRTEWETRCKLENDPRITRIGKVLRRLSIDELPQLINVIRGDMSLVGPRPLPDYHETELVNRVKSLRRRVRPGLTGLWQVSGRSDTGNAGIEQYDAYYVRNWSIWLDIVILVRTVRAVIRSSGAY